MAKFTAPVNLNLRLPGGFEVEGAAGATHRIPDSLVEEFIRDQVPGIPGGVTWITQDETSAIPTLPIAQSNVSNLVSDLAALTAADAALSAVDATKYDKVGGTISGAATVTGTLGVGGAATLSSTLGVTGLATMAAIIANALTATASVRSRDIGGVVYADQYSSIQAAINALGNNGGRVFISPGAYTVGSPGSTAPGLTFPTGDSSTFSFELIGAGAGATRITYAGTGWAVDTSAATATIASQLVMQGISFIGTTAALSGCLRLKNVHRSRFRDLQIQDFNGTGAWAVVLDGSGGASLGAHHNLIQGCDISGCTNGVKLTGSSGAGQSNANRIIGNRISISVAGGTAVLVDVGDTNLILGNSIFTNAASCTGLVVGDDRNMCAYNRLEASTATGTIGVSVRSDATYATVGPMTVASFGTETANLGTGTDLHIVRSTNGGRRVPVATFAVSNVAASAVETVVPLGGMTASESPLWVPLINASVAGISWRWGATISAGTFTVHLVRGGSSVGDTGSQSSANRAGQKEYVPGAVTVSTAQSLGISVSTSTNWSPTTNDLVVFLWAYD